MRRTITSAIALPTLALAAAAQTPPAPPPSPPTLRAQARLVVVDVVVTDKNHTPIHNLKQSDFSLSEKNQPQKITLFEEHTALTAADAVQFPPLPRMPPGVFTNFVPTPVNAAVNILLLDALNTPQADQAYVHAQVLDYLKKPRPGTSVAIFALTSRLSLLQGFTSNPELLQRIVLKQLGKSSPLLDDPVSGAPAESTVDQLGDIGVVLPADIAAHLQTFDNMTQSFQLQLRAKYTLDALNQLALYLANIPGRKNLIWFSGSFPINILPDPSGTASDPFAAVASSEEEYRETTNLLARAQVAVYPIDARGLMVSPNLSAASPNSRFARNPAAFGQAEQAFLTKTADEHSTMYRMADDTGGRAFVNTNGLTQAVASAIDAGSNFYTLAYTPTDAKWQGDFRTIQIKLEEKGLLLAYRHGYYADNPDSKYSALASTPATPAASADPIPKAMAHGLPGPTQIIFKARVLPSSAQPEDILAHGNQSPPGRAKGPFRRFDIDIAADPRQLVFTRTPDALYHGAVQLIALVYTPDGALVNTQLNTFQLTLPDAQLKSFLRTGIPFHQQISVPDKGDYSLRVGVYDLRSRRIGATELPIAAVKNLPPIPLPVPPSSPAAKPPPPPSTPTAPPS